jgi:DNA-binding IclR family transcriptional regulator
VAGPRSAPAGALVVSAPVSRLDEALAGKIAVRLEAEAARLSELTGGGA